jgi:hypothetical protein
VHKKSRTENGIKEQKNSGADLQRSKKADQNKRIN